MKIGGDHEFTFTTRDGTAFPATLLLPPQHSPMYAADEWDEYGAALYEDGINGEFGLHETECRDSLMIQMFDAMKKANEVAKAGWEGQRLYLKTGSGHPTTLEIKQMGGPKAMNSGCAPDVCAYTGDKQRGIVDYPNFPHAVCGFHIHIDVPKRFRTKSEREQEMLKIVKLMDITTTIPFMLLEPRENHAKIRREAGYGRAGAFRIKEYGLEYRTPSGNGLRCPEFSSLLMGACRDAVEMYLDGAADEVIKAAGDRVEGCINTCSKRTARYIMKKAMPVICDEHSDMNSIWYGVDSDFIHGTYPLPKQIFDFLSHPKMSYSWYSSSIEKAWGLDKPHMAGEGWCTGFTRRLNNDKKFHKLFEEWRKSESRFA